MMMLVWADIAALAFFEWLIVNEKVRFGLNDVLLFAEVLLALLGWIAVGL